MAANLGFAEDSADTVPYVRMEDLTRQGGESTTGMENSANLYWRLKMGTQWCTTRPWCIVVTIVSVTMCLAIVTILGIVLWGILIHGCGCSYGIAASPCSLEPCLNSGECLDNDEKYICICPSGFGGKTCKMTLPTGVPVASAASPCSLKPCLNSALSSAVPPTPTASVCGSGPCLNSGECLDNAQNFTCLCQPGFGGRLCGLITNATNKPAFVGCSQGPFGTCNGDVFDDRVYGSYGRITQIRIRHYSWVDAIQVQYGEMEAERHGGSGGDESIISLWPDERVIGAQGMVGTENPYITSLQFFTNNRTFGPYGTHRGDLFVVTGNELRWISGRSDQHLDSIMFHFDFC